jgi:hypothetical protein
MADPVKMSSDQLGGVTAGYLGIIPPVNTTTSIALLAAESVTGVQSYNTAAAVGLLSQGVGAGNTSAINAGNTTNVTFGLVP